MSMAENFFLGLMIGLFVGYVACWGFFYVPLFGAYQNAVKLIIDLQIKQTPKQDEGK